MTDDCAAAFCQAHIKLKTVAAVFESEVERGNGILRGEPRHAEAAMTQQERHFHWNVILRADVL